MIEAVVELLVEIFVQVGGELLGDALGSLFSGRRRAQRRAVAHDPATEYDGLAVLILMAGLGCAGGLVWGRHVRLDTDIAFPRSIYVSVGLAAVFAVLATVRAREPEAARSGLTLVQPWTWGPRRLWRYAITSFLVAVGIGIGYVAFHEPDTKLKDTIHAAVVVDVPDPVRSSPAG